MREFQVADAFINDSAPFLAEGLFGWSRLEVLPEAFDQQTSLQAGVHDPLWMLGRQWQVREFAGEDAGTPIELRLSVETSRLSRFAPGPLAAAAQNARDFDGALPLEAQIEREPARANHARLALEAGLHFLRLLGAQPATGGLASAYRAAYPLAIDAAPIATADQASRDWALLARGRAIDGAALAEDLRAERAGDGSLARLPPEPPLGAEVTEAVKAIAQRWLAWYEAAFTEPAAGPSAWNPQRQEYALAVQADMEGGPVILDAEEYSGERLDWYSFDATDRADRRAGVGPADLGRPTEPSPSRITTLRPCLPTPVRFPGMPAERYWEFEDAHVLLPSLDAGKGDLARMLLVEFALVYGNDWFLAPMQLPVGSLTAVRTCEVRDTFGEVSRVPAARQLGRRDARWEMFSLAPAPGAPDALGDLLFLPPTLPAESVEGAPLEETALFRDELANMAWAVERRVQGNSGEGYDRRDEGRPFGGQRLDVMPDDVSLVYRLMTPTPENWIPFVPVPAAQAAGVDLSAFAIRLERRSMLRFPVAEEPAPPIGATPPFFPPPAAPADLPAPPSEVALVAPRGLLLRSDPNLDLAASAPLQIEDEEIPREGIMVRRSFQSARWLNGARVTWLGRSKSVGRGEGSSGLRFDVARKRR
jgi:hypothetical protein